MYAMYRVGRVGRGRGGKKEENGEQTSQPYPNAPRKSIIPFRVVPPPLTLIPIHPATRIRVRGGMGEGSGMLMNPMSIHAI